MGQTRPALPPEHPHAATLVGPGRPVAPPAALRWVGRFVVLREVGRGAMGVVYAGYDEELDRRVAIKLVSVDDHAETSRGRNQLLREAQALARLTHPHVVAVFEAGVHESQVFLAMEYVEGVDLERWLTSERRGWRAVIATFLQAGAGLLAAHRVGLVHRDFKPSNVLVGDDGRVRVADFGLAARADRPDDPRPGAPRGPAHALAATIVGAGGLAGTPAYMAAELFHGAPATAASDQYAFCVALWEALYGQAPFVGDTLAALVQQVLEGELPAAPPDPAVPAWVHAIVRRGLARDPAARFPDLAALLAALARDPELERRRRRQRAALVATAVLATLALVFGGGALYRAATRDAHERRATARLDALRDQLAGLLAEGRDDEAARAFAGFVALDDNRGTAALGRAYRAWGELQRDPAAASDAFAAGYVHARTPEDRLAALRELTLRLAAGGDADGAVVALATLDAQAPSLVADPELASLRLMAALERRDLAAAGAALERVDSAPLRDAARPVLAHLARATATAVDLPRVQRLAPRERVARGDVDGDGRPEVLAPAPSRGPDVVQILRGDASLAPIAEVRVPAFALPDGGVTPARLGDGPWPVPAGPDGPRLLVGVELPGERALRAYGLVPLTPGAAPERVWIDSASNPAVGDLDGDGAPELYVGTGAYSRHLLRLTREAAGSWRIDAPHLRTDAVKSDINDLAVGDLDGDGAPELVAAVGAWNAYEVRVFRAGAGGELELVARRTLGSVASLALVRDEHGLRVAALKRDEYPNARRFATPPHFGAPAGVYVLALVDDELAISQFVPLDGSWTLVEPADLDGDARDELVLTGKRDFAVVVRGPEAFLEPLRIAGESPVLVMNLDDDPATELVVPDGDGRVLVLGAGEAATPALTRELPTARPIREDLDDPAIAGAWRHAEELAAIGLARRSADELVAMSSLAPRAREDMLLRAGELYATAGDHAAAAEQFEAAAARPELAAQALAGAIRGHRALRRFAAAAALAEARAALPELDAAARAASAAEAAALRRTAAPRPELALRFDRPLDPGWRIADPLALARDLGGRDLIVHTSSEALLAELPIAWDGGSVDLVVDLRVDAIDWNAGLAFTIEGEDSLPWLGVGVRAGGSSRRPDRRAYVYSGDRSESEVLDPIVPASPGGRLRLHFRHDVELGVAFAEVVADGAEPVRRSLPDPPFMVPSTPPRGPLHLRLRSGLGDPKFVGRARVAAIELVGFRATAAPVDAAAPARQIVEGELVAALAGLADAKGGLAGLWRAHLLTRLGRDDAATAELAAALRDADDALVERVDHLLRHDPGPFHRVARRVLGGELDELLAPMIDDLSLRPSAVGQLLADLDAHPLAPPTGGDPTANQRHCAALYVRGAAWQQAGRLDLARRDLEAAWLVLDDPSRRFPLRDALRRQVGRKLLELAVAAGEPDAARRWLAVQRRDSEMPEITLESWREYPGLRALIGADAWPDG